MTDEKRIKRFTINIVTVFLAFIAILSFQSCFGGNEPADEIRIVDMLVSSQTGTTYSLFDDKREYPIECMLVRSPNDDRWIPMTFGSIEGFEFERGYEYDLVLFETKLANPPMDAPDRTYKLKEVISKTLVVVDDIKPSYHLSCVGGSIEITFKPRNKRYTSVVNNSGWTYDFVTSVTPEKWSISFKVKPNDGEARETNVEITVGEDVYNISVCQMAKPQTF